jgi:hypothetical protein
MGKKQESLLNHIQAVFYISSLDLSQSKPLELALALKKSPSLGLDGQEIIYPIPLDSPLELPKIVLSDKNNAITCQIATNRVDLFMITPKENIEGNKSLNTLKKNLQSLSNIIKGNFGAKIHRIALVLQTVTSTEGDPLNIFQEKYSKIAFDKTVDAAMLSFLNKNTLGKFKVNKWTRIRTLKKADEQTQGNYLQIAFDINTLQENDYNLDNQSIEEFVNLATNDIIQSLKTVLNNK